MPIVFFALLLAALTGWQARRAIETRIAPNEIRERHLSANMLLWHQAAVSWRQSHPGYSGAIPNAALLLPAWYIPMAPWHSMVLGGALSTYASALDGVQPNRLAAQLAVWTQDGVNAGLSLSGRVSPPDRPALVPVPAGVPDGAAVLVTAISP